MSAGVRLVVLLHMLPVTPIVTSSSSTSHASPPGFITAMRTRLIVVTHSIPTRRMSRAGMGVVAPRCIVCTCAVRIVSPISFMPIRVGAAPLSQCGNRRALIDAEESRGGNGYPHGRQGALHQQLIACGEVYGHTTHTGHITNAQQPTQRG